MKKYNLIKVLGITLLITWLLTFIIPTSTIQEVIKRGSITPFGIWNLLLNSSLSFTYFNTLGIYIVIIAILYGMLELIKQYNDICDKIAKAFKDKKRIALIISILFFSLLSLVVSDVLILLVFVPFFWKILLKLDIDKKHIVLVTIISMLVGSIGLICSTTVATNFSASGTISPTENILPTLILGVLSIGALIVFMIMNTKKLDKKKLDFIKKENIAKVIKIKKDKPQKDIKQSIIKIGYKMLFLLPISCFVMAIISYFGKKHKEENDAETSLIMSVIYIIICAVVMLVIIKEISIVIILFSIMGAILLLEIILIILKKNNKEQNIKVKKTSYLILTFLLGSIGINKLYSKEYSKAMASLLFSFTLIPFILSLIDFVIQILNKSDKKGYIVINNKKRDNILFVVGSSIVSLLILLFTIPWESIFKTTIFTNFNTWFFGLKIGNYFSTTNFIGNTDVIGTWSFSSISALLIIIIVAIVLIYSIDFNKFISTMTASIKKALPIAITVILINTVLMVAYSSGIILTAMDSILGLTGKSFNVITATLASIVSTTFLSDILYSSSILGGVVAAKSIPLDVVKLIAFVLKSISGIMAIIVPVSAGLIIGLYYFDIPYTKWIKYIWKLFVVLILLVIAFTSIFVLI